MYTRTATKQNCSTRPSMSTAVMPPATAPTDVATSSSIPKRTLVMPRLTNVVCAMDEVAITQTMLVAIATLMGTPKARLSMGTMMMPPPTPSMLPKTPATKATARSAARTPVTAASVVAGRGPSQTLDDGAAFLGGEAPLHRRARGPCGPARRRRRRVQLDELEPQATQRVHLVEVLAALRPTRHREARGPVAQPHRAVGDVLVPVSYTHLRA